MGRDQNSGPTFSAYDEFVALESAGGAVCGGSPSTASYVASFEECHMYGISVDHVVSTPSDQIPRSQAELVVTLIVGAVWLGCLVSPSAQG